MKMGLCFNRGLPNGHKKKPARVTRITLAGFKFSDGRPTSLSGVGRSLGEVGVDLLVLLSRQVDVSRQPRHVPDVVVAQDLLLVRDELEAHLERVLRLRLLPSLAAPPPAAVRPGLRACGRTRGQERCLRQRPAGARQPESAVRVPPSTRAAGRRRGCPRSSRCRVRRGSARAPPTPSGGEITAPRPPRVRWPAPGS